jgi:hypothetical protein
MAALDWSQCPAAVVACDLPQVVEGTRGDGGARDGATEIT